MKDNFSKQASSYVKFRPGYPPELFKFIGNLPVQKYRLWDCGTGNGQVAVPLAEIFQKVYATDISQNQLNQAPLKKNISYKLASAENSGYPDHFFDAVTVAQAIHWFNFERFYNEAQRTLKSGGVLAIISYGLLETEERIQNIVNRFYKHVVGPYWDPERKYLDENYETIPLPPATFTELNTPQFSYKISWNKNELVGYLNSWSAVQHYKTKENADPLEQIYDELNTSWNDNSSREFVFPTLLRVFQKT